MKKTGAANMVVLTLILSGVLMSAAAQVMLKLGMSAPAVQAGLGQGEIASVAMSLLRSPWLLGGLLIYGLSVVVWLVVLARVDVSYAYPFVALGMVVTTLSGHYLLGEGLPVMRVVGVAIIVAGVVLLALSYPTTHSGHEGHERQLASGVPGAGADAGHEGEHKGSLASLSAASPVALAEKD
jgi:multidrug transporter EmrE-like cation transporter